MPFSMTGFGQASFADSDMSADVIVRSVNGKHLKTKVVLGMNLPAVVDRICALTARHMTRGTVEVSVRLDWAGAGGMAFNERILSSYVRQLEKLRTRLGMRGEVSIDQVALMPGAMVADGASARAANHVWRKIEPVVTEALDRTRRMQMLEGRALARDLRRSCAAIRRLMKAIQARKLLAGHQYRHRLTQRINALLQETGTQLEPGALAREIILYGERSDITEELCRMKAHVAHFLQALREPSAGRKLEFIAQEMHREANTMTSKASDPQMTELIIDLRGEVDQIREQVLNLE